MSCREPSQGRRQYLRLPGQVSCFLMTGPLIRQVRNNTQFDYSFSSNPAQGPAYTTLILRHPFLQVSSLWEDCLPGWGNKKLVKMWDAAYHWLLVFFLELSSHWAEASHLVWALWQKTSNTVNLWATLPADWAHNHLKLFLSLKPPLTFLYTHLPQHRTLLADKENHACIWNHTCQLMSIKQKILPQREPNYPESKF